MNNENKNPNVEEELKKQSQETAENEQTTSEASEAQGKCLFRRKRN